MPWFAYKALRSDGTEVSGEIEARERGEALQKLGSKGWEVFFLGDSNKKESAPRKKGEPERAAPAKERGKAAPAVGSVRLTASEVILFSDELTDLLGAGFRLEPALRLIGRRGEKSRIQQVAVLIEGRVREGFSFSDALKRSSPSFGDLYCNLVAAGEHAAALEPLLRRQVEYLTIMQDLRRKLTTATIYPIFLIVSAVTVTGMFIAFLVPKLTKLIEATRATPPLGTRIMIAMSDFLVKNGWLIFGAVVGGLMLLLVLLRSKRFREEWDRVRLKIPVMGSVELAGFYVQTLETVANIMASGLLLPEALRLSKGITNNSYLRKQMQTLTEKVNEGTALHQAMEGARVFPGKLVDLVRVGEESGLQNTLTKAAQRYQKELGIRIDRIAALIQPTIIVAMSVLVGSIAYMMITSIYQTISLLRPGG